MHKGIVAGGINNNVSVLNEMRDLLRSVWVARWRYGLHLGPGCVISDDGLHGIHFVPPNVIMASNVAYDVPRRQEVAVDDFQGIKAALSESQCYMTSQCAGPKEDGTASLENLCVGSGSESKSLFVIRFGY